MSGFMTDLIAECVECITIPPQNINGATVLSAAIDMKNAYRLAVILNVNTIAATGLLDCKLVQAVTSGGTYKDIAGKAITQLTNASSPVTKPLIIEVRSDELDVPNNYRFVKVSITDATAVALVGATILVMRDYLPTDQTLWLQAIL
jgi:hypothetical protein